MSGRIKLKVRLGDSKDWRYDKYPEAFLEITGECGNKVNISPSYKDITNMLILFRKHELKVDLTRKRKRYTSKLINTLKQAIPKLKVLKLTEFDKKNIDEIYFKPKLK